MDRAKHIVLDLISIFTPAILVIATQLENLESFRGVQWPAVVAAALGALVTWARTATGGLRAEPKAPIELNLVDRSRSTEFNPVDRSRLG